jgi:hypothetical protein
MKIFSVCARVEYQGKDAVDLGLFISANAALLAAKKFIDKRIRAASKVYVELYTFSTSTLNEDSSLSRTSIDIFKYNPSTKKYDDLNPVLFV